MLIVVDNYDSFTFNLAQMLWTLDVPIRVVRNDEVSATEILAETPVGLVLSPGPGWPSSSGLSAELLALRPAVPVLGVCLGHQVVAAEFGAPVERAPEPVHGKTVEVRHRGGNLFAGVATPFTATRYHSLHVPAEGLPSELEPTAWSPDGVLMGLRHRELPYWGVQFHPESILTLEGRRIVANFVELCASRLPGTKPEMERETEREPRRRA